MWVSGHCVFLAAVIFVLESAVIFIYTTIGLIKANPMPFILPAPVFPYQCPPQYQQPFNEPASLPTTSRQLELTPESTLFVTSTIYQTMVMVVVSETPQVRTEAALTNRLTKDPLPPTSSASLSSLLPLNNSSIFEPTLSTSAISASTSTLAALSSSSQSVLDVVTAVVVVTTTLPPTSQPRPTFTVTEVIPASLAR